MRYSVSSYEDEKWNSVHGSSKNQSTVKTDSRWQLIEIDNFNPLSYILLGISPNCDTSDNHSNKLTGSALLCPYFMFHKSYAWGQIRVRKLILCCRLKKAGVQI